MFEDKHPYNGGNYNEYLEDCTKEELIKKIKKLNKQNHGLIRDFVDKCMELRGAEARLKKYEIT